ncbi:MAG: glycosyltransferase [Bacteriovoracaceae bacterium]|nr:glycosyltransferase [Bacteriovoracaceae bacterium]
MPEPRNKFLFNFSSSYSGGGLQILVSYLDFFNKNGGSFFILNSRLKNKLSKEYPNNKLFFVEINKVKRFVNDMYYLTPIVKNLPPLDLYFSYGIPVYKKVARNNWFHVSNMIPIEPMFNYLGKFQLLQMRLLGFRINKYARNADFLSADSKDALEKSQRFLKYNVKNNVVLKNGIDDSFIRLRGKNKIKNAVTIGTQPYKDLIRLYRLYKWLQKEGKVSKLTIIGSVETIPKQISEDSSVILKGIIEPDQVHEELSSASTYISTSLIENSSVAALEGLYLCPNSYLSKIGPHKEMLEDAQLSFESIEIQEVGEFYHVDQEVPSDYIKSISWDNVNRQFLNYLKSNLS